MRIGEGSINVEAFSTLVELLPLYHDHILKEDTQITLDCGMETKFVKSVKVLLEVVKRSQILIELYFIYKASKRIIYFDAFIYCSKRACIGT